MRDKWWQTLGNLSQMGSALAAIFALGFIAYQVSQIEINYRKSNARQVYLAYSNASLKYPEFLRPENLADIKANPVRFEQYKWYVAQMMFAYDEMISVGDQSWARSFQLELPDHRPLLCDLKKNEPGFFEQFESKTNVLIEQSLKGKCPTE
jgi:hypothetical protein